MVPILTLFDIVSSITTSINSGIASALQQWFATNAVQAIQNAGPLGLMLIGIVLVVVASLAKILLVIGLIIVAVAVLMLLYSAGII